MKISFVDDFVFSLNKQVDYIAKDKPIAARKFKKDLLKNIKKDLKNPFNFKRSIYYNDENIRDYVFKGYVCIYEVDHILNTVFVFGFIKYRASL